jgi:hypothetical protein
MPMKVLVGSGQQLLVVLGPTYSKRSIEMLNKLLIPTLIFSVSVAIGCSSSSSVPGKDGGAGTSGTAGAAGGKAGAAGGAAGGVAGGTAGGAGHDAGTDANGHG